MNSPSQRPEIPSNFKLNSKPLSFGPPLVNPSLPSTSPPQQWPTATSYDTSELVIELQRRESVIMHQHNRILQLEEELILYNKQIERLLLQLAKQSKMNEMMNQKSPKNKPNQTRYWTPEEHNRFLEALKLYGPKDVKGISNHVGSRNPTQVRTHAQKYFLKLQKEKSKNPDGGNTSESDSSPEQTGPEETTPTKKMDLTMEEKEELIEMLGTPKKRSASSSFPDPDIQAEAKRVALEKAIEAGASKSLPPIFERLILPLPNPPPAAVPAAPEFSEALHRTTPSSSEEMK